MSKCLFPEAVKRIAEKPRIDVVSDTFDPRKRTVYFDSILTRLKAIQGRTKAVLLDPDNGIAEKMAGPKHVDLKEVQSVWEALSPNDWLVVYQHAYRDTNWLDSARRRLSTVVARSDVHIFRSPYLAHDVALLAARMPRP
jgi:hypothetical protein